jgi:hypothetical protein
VPSDVLDSSGVTASQVHQSISARPQLRTQAGTGNYTVSLTDALVQFQIAGGPSQYPNIGSSIAFGWNFTNGSGEVDIWNPYDPVAINVAVFYFNQIRGGTNHVVFSISGWGALRSPYYGAGTLNVDASGNFYNTSDARMKNVLGSFDAGLKEVLQLEPVRYRWREDSGLDPTFDNVGFLAQDVQKIVPEAVGGTSDSMLSFSDRPLIAALVNAVKELSGTRSDRKRPGDTVLIGARKGYRRGRRS